MDEKRKPGRPRDLGARSKILEAAYGLLMEQGLGRLTVEAVAARAEVGKPTIYRYWANAQELAMAALLVRPPALDAGEAGRTARAKLAAQVGGVIAAFATPRGRQIALIMAATEGESELSKAFRNQIILGCREAGRAILTRAVERREIVPLDDMETVLDTIYGPIFYRLLAGHLPLDKAFGEGVVALVLRGLESAR
jgi:AcrR family transcriptional regulator